MLRTRVINIDFFTGVLGADTKTSITRICEGVSKKPAVHQCGRHDYELRRVKVSGRTVRGALARIRSDDLPHAGRPGGAERELGLADDEGLLEKNHFLFDEERNLLVFQRNGNGGRVGQLADYLSACAGQKVRFSPVLTKDSTQRLMSNDVQPVKVELSFTRPTNPALYPAQSFSRRLFELLGETGAATVRLSLSADRRSTEIVRHRLRSMVRSAACRIVDADLASTAKVTVTDGEHDYPIDLIADRLTDEQEVEFVGRYPREGSIYGAFDKALRDCRKALDDVLGKPGQRLA